MTARRNLEWSDGAAGPLLHAVATPVVDWRSRSVCRPADDHLFFPPAGPGAERAVRLAKNICKTCPVVTECLEWAIAHPVDTQYGVWGGLTLNERQHPGRVVAPIKADRATRRVPRPLETGKKRCCRCHHLLPLGEFYRRADSADGRQSRCKGCEDADRKARAAA